MKGCLFFFANVLSHLAVFRLSACFRPSVICLTNWEFIEEKNPLTPHSTLSLCQIYFLVHLISSPDSFVGHALLI